MSTDGSAAEDPVRGTLGALILALGTLRPQDDATAARIAEIILGLGLDLGAGPAAAAPPAAPGEVVRPTQAPPKPHAGGVPPAPSAGPAAASTRPAPRQVPSDVVSLVATMVSGPTAAAVARAARPASPPPERWVRVDPPLDPLLDPTWTRGLVTAAVATRLHDGDVDVAALAERLSRREPIRRLPRQGRASLARGVRVMIDRGPGMAPFARDATDLADRVRAVVGVDRTDVRRFLRSPRLSGASALSMEPLPPPDDGRPVIAVSDVGIAPAGAAELDVGDEWRRFVAEHREAGAPVVVLVPYPEWRWPAWLAGEVPLLAWDRTTSLATVRALLARRARAGAVG